ncbi:SDR family NAD(P)-dependent oxidoreductase [Kribbella shirazensis]|uniref:NAD(P)-dependent dehydrogenase (Short-subunit alcohol dehydrogenase family) n=1 Tax=Kribbella shirazensis TaxID=1105143 RepID=A0A7X5V8E9_9ACTN|nr:SDR family NAD(P)-dependent oxidoreductase [Kribbella shirazensis]NIK56529.1 NAD(P)-dependent dehydrogenase (short-subunit alcohol dehydrogenase family) [Kribbella shirazensis]
MGTLAGKVALVTGASRGVGKGIALGLGEQGATVYVTGRTESGGPATTLLPGTVQKTAAEVTALGGRGVAIGCDHRDDEQTRRAVQRVLDDAGRLDVLVNNVWGGYEYFWDGTPFWEEAGFWTQPLERWDSAFRAGVRAHYVTSVAAAPTMVAQGAGLIVSVSSEGAAKVDTSVAYGAAKAATDHMIACMAHELRDHGVTAVSLYPGLVRTESVLRAAEYFDLSDSESPQFVGRGVAALAADPEVIRFTGQVVRSSALADEYGFSDPVPR